MIAITQGTEVLYLFSDAAVIAGRQVTDGGVTITMSDAGTLVPVTGVSVPAGTQPFLCDYLGGVVSINVARQAAYVAQQNAALYGGYPPGQTQAALGSQLAKAAKAGNQRLVNQLIARLAALP